MAQAAVFLDRDGTLNEQVPGYVSEPEDLRMIMGAADALARLSALNVPIVLISNQQGVGKGLMSMEQLQRVEQRLRDELAASGAAIAGAYYCTHLASEGCACRKPLPGLLIRAASDLGISLPRSFMVGDSPGDMQAGRAAGVTTVLVPTGLASPESLCDAPVDYCASDLADAVRWIIEKLSSSG